MPSIFPDDTAKNFVICVPGTGTKNDFCALITDAVPCRDNIEKGQCFPLYVYEENDGDGNAGRQGGLFDTTTSRSYRRKDAITDDGFSIFLKAYPQERFCKEDLFYYVYGLLHSQDYRERYADNLSKELPRIPCVKAATDFWAFSKAGRKLAELHLDYENVAPYQLKVECNERMTNADFRVEKMSYGKSGKEKDMTTLHYNDKVTLIGIPLEAYEYVVNGKPALDWVVERQRVKTDADSGIVNDANDWALETMKNPRYPLDLFLRVITVSLETMKIVKSLPKLGELG